MRLYVWTLLAPLGALTAQQADATSDVTSVATSELRIPIHTADADPAGGNYGIWAGGGDYKVSFHGGMTFVPLLGKQAARNAELSWHTVSVRVGERELLEHLEPQAVAAGDYRFEYRFDAVTEAYDVRPDGLEQTFVLSQRPPGNGDLVIRGQLDGNVTAPDHIARHHEIAFQDQDGRTVIGYGAATAIDAYGAQVPMTTSYLDGVVELRLDGEAMADLAFPLVVDPLLNNELIGVDSGVQDFDVYRDDEQSLSNVWMVYSRAASASDLDLLVRRFPDDFSGPGATVFSDMSSSWSSVGGQIAGLGGSGAGKTITAFTREFTGGSRRVRWHLHDKDDATLQSNYGSIASPVDYNEWRPDIGGTRSNVVGNTALLVYQREHNGATVFANTVDSGIYAVRIDTTNSINGVQSAAIAVADNTTDDYERPAVNQVAEGGVQFSWVVVYQQHSNSSTGTWNVIAKRVPENFGTIGNGNYISLSPQKHEMSPRIEGADGRYLIVWGERDPVVGKPDDSIVREVITRRFNWQHNANNGQWGGSKHYLVSAPDNRYEIGEVGHDVESRSHWLVTYTDDRAGFERLYAQKVGFDGKRSQQNIAYDIAGFLPLPPGVCYDEDNDRFTLVWGVDNGFGTNPIVSAYVDYDPASPPLLYGVGCASNATTTFEGSQHIGSEFETFRLNSTDAGIPALFVLGTLGTYASLDGLGMTGCGLAVDPNGLMGTLLLTTDALGDATVTLPIPSSVTPVTVRSQWFLLQPGANPAGITSTRGLRVGFSN